MPGPQPKPDPEYAPPEPVEENPQLVGEPDLLPLWAISQVIEERRKVDELAERIEKLEKRHGTR